MRIIQLVCIIIISYLNGTYSNITQRSSKIDQQRPEYYLVAMCHRSNLKYIKKQQCHSLEGCKRLAVEKEAMAFNFSPPDRFHRRNTANISKGLKNCYVFSCPEVENSTSLMPDFRFDYYSVYADPIPPINSSCVEGIGVFIIHLLELNYTEAKGKCQKHGAVLPDVATERRTNLLSDLLLTSTSKFGPSQMYIGMDNLDTEEHVRSNGELLTSTTYRAWAPGHPKNRRRQHCCTLDKKRMWKVVDCKMKMPFICEVYPGGWYQDYDSYDSSLCFDLSLNW